MKRLMLLVLGSLALVLLVIVGLPARLIPLVVDDTNLRLSGLSGTVFDGRAARALVRTPAGFLHLGSVSWDVDPWSVLTLKPSLDLRMAWGAQRAELSLQSKRNTTTLRDVDASIDAKLLRTLAPLAVEGRIGLQLAYLRLDGFSPMEADGRLVWQSAVWRSSSREHPLGSYVAQIQSPDDQVLAATIDTLSGPVAAVGFARLTGSRYDLDLTISGRDRALAPEVERALRLFASPEEDGYLLRLDGDLAIAP